MKRILLLIMSFLMVNFIDAHPINWNVKNISTDLLDLAGEINIIQHNKYATVSYSGEEDVTYSITVNGYDVINDYAYASWDSIMNCYQFDLIELGPISYYEQYYTLHYFFKVTVSADGYNSLSDSTYMSCFLTPDFDPPTIASWLTPESLIIYVSNWPCSTHSLYIDGVWVDSYEHDSFEVLRQDEDYMVSVSASYKTAMMSEWLSYSETLLVPAKLFGDLDGDETLSVSDVALLIDCLLGYGYDYYNNGDVNKNGEISISDVTMLIDKILQPSI